MRYREADLTPIGEKVQQSTYHRGRTRLECWSATSRDGLFLYERIDGMRGTPWQIVHVPSGVVYPEMLYGSLNAARTDTHTYEAKILAAILHEARRIAGEPSYLPGARDRARAAIPALEERVAATPVPV